jgi:hypothetical protein
MRALFGYLIAVALGLVSQFLKDHSWLAAALLCAALATAVLATLGLARDMGLGARLAAVLKRLRLAPRGIEGFNSGMPTKAAPPKKVPRPAGPVGPMPVMQKRPKDATGDPVGGAAPSNPQGPSNPE